MYRRCVTTHTFGSDVLPQSTHTAEGEGEGEGEGVAGLKGVNRAHSRFPGDDFGPDGGLDGHLIQLPVDDTLQSLADGPTHCVCAAMVDHRRQHVYRGAVKEDVQLEWEWGQVMQWEWGQVMQWEWEQVMQWEWEQVMQWEWE